MLSSYRWSAPLLAAVLIMSGCAVDRPRDTHSTSYPTTPAPVPTPEPAKVPPPVHREPAKAPVPASTAVPSAPTTGGTGYYQDRQESVLNERLAGTGVRVQRNADSIKLIIPGRLAFSLSSDQIQPAFTPILDSVAQVLKEYARTVVDIRGYTDSTGSFEHNQQLSERRAQSVGGYLIARQIGAARIRTAGYGPRYPIAGNDTEGGRAQNRRLEIELVPTP